MDTSFGSGGVVNQNVVSRLGDPFSGSIFNPGFDGIAAIKIQGDGKILALGKISDPRAGETSYSGSPCKTHLALARYNSNGTPDTSFGSAGLTTLTNISGVPYPHLQGSFTYVFRQADLVLQSDGKILVFGKTEDMTNPPRDLFFVARLNTDGSLDSSFGSAGVVTTDFEGSARTKRALRIFIQSDNKIVVVGRDMPGDESRILVARYNENGSLDSTYGVGGKLFVAHGNYRDPSNYVWNGELVIPVMQTDNKIVFAGYIVDRVDHGTSHEAAPIFYNILYRLTTDGNLDTSFGTDGKVVGPYNNVMDIVYYSLATQNDGKIIAVGARRQPDHLCNMALDFATTVVQTEPCDLAIMRFNADGSADLSFADRGTLLYNFGNYTTVVRTFPYNTVGAGVAIQPDGKIIISGGIAGNDGSAIGVEHRGGLTLRTLLLKLNSDGSFDTSFGTNGVATGFGRGTLVEMNGMDLQNDCKIVQGGLFNNIISNDIDNITNTDFILTRHENNGCVGPAAPSISAVSSVPTSSVPAPPKIIYQRLPPDITVIPPDPKKPGLIDKMINFFKK